MNHTKKFIQRNSQMGIVSVIANEREEIIEPPIEEPPYDHSLQLNRIMMITGRDNYYRKHPKVHANSFYGEQN